ncbi:MAG: hypothetical protein KJ007_14255 [Burkholderiales bacterium]|nr:hypothetical protein [Burkholderiales bacterium]
MTPAFAPILAAVQANCHLSDARHAQDLTLCNYLLAMREYYRWENDLPPQAVPPRGEVARWIAERESLWDGLAAAEWAPVPLAAGPADPFDVAAVNAELVPAGLLYGAGRGRFGKPHFFLARLARHEWRDGVEVLEAGCEYARDLDAAPAVLQGETIVLRREAFRDWLRLTAEAWEARAPEGPLAAAFEAYGYHDGQAQALERMAVGERETLLLHELGELAAGRLLGEGWERFMARVEDRRVEVTARAVRDLLADCLVTLPALIERGAGASLHFWFGTMSSLRRTLFPRALAAREAWLAGSGTAALQEAAAAGRDHWLGIARALAADAGEARRMALDPACVALA